MSAPIDVAEVFVRAEGQARLVTGLTADPSARQLLKDLAAARDAFAELIKAADRLERKAVEQARLTSTVFSRDVESLRAALARVRGAK